MRSIGFNCAVSCCVVIVAAGTTVPAPPDDAGRLAQRIDRRLEAMWAQAKVKPTTAADDAEFLRRVYLDVAGRIPSVAESKQFLDDAEVDKRARLVAKLLASAAYATHFAHVWRDLMFPREHTLANRTSSLEAWLQARFSENARYDRMVRELLTVSVAPNTLPFPGDRSRPPTPVLFYYGQDSRPENLAAATARIFLGVSMECAQCHDHPFGAWKREQFWQFTAFFSGIVPSGGNPFPESERPAAKEIAIPGTKIIVPAKFPDGAEPAWREGVPTRQTLADWLTAPANPYFSRTAVNRVWAHFFGRGLVEPLNDFADAKADSVTRELLDELSTEFAQAGFDFTYLIRAITATRAYQLSSRAGDGAGPAERFARMPVRGLTPDQLFDSFAIATGWKDDRPKPPPFQIDVSNPRTRFLNRFGVNGIAARDQPTTILQALTLMNGPLTASALDRGQTLQDLLADTRAGAAEKIESLYLGALARRPTRRELALATRFVEARLGDSETGSPDQRAREAYGDLFWALLNSAEFCLNH
jgi:Protein of unknown function (DUF1549)/Protein of unknown function (DUF1553)